MHNKPLHSSELAVRQIRRALSIACIAGGAGGLLFAWLYQFSPMAHVLSAVFSATCSACLCAVLLGRIAGLNTEYQPRASAPSLEKRMRFSRVIGVHMLRKNTKKQPITFADVIAANIQPPQPIAFENNDFQPATIVYDSTGGYSSSDTFSREQGVATARIALLSMDHTKQIPH